MRPISLYPVILAGLFLAAAPAAFPQAPDNTKMNQGDGKKSATTADSSMNNKSDRDIAKEIRKSVVDDKSLSTYGHNVKIISEHGHVTLKGPVHSDDEKTNIEGKAKAVAGDGNVDNQLTVKGR